MAIFNSLGSNYNFGFVLRALMAGNKESYRLRLVNYLEKKYGGEVLFTYKGREALRLALRLSDVSRKYAVGICGFTCFAVYMSVVKEGRKVRYMDIAEKDLNFSLEKFTDVIKKHPSIKILVIQNTLGFTGDGKKIAKYCRDRGIILVEDLAHSIGAEYEDGTEAGTVGDFTVLSFSQDKMVDGVSGGALIVRNSKFSTDLIGVRIQSGFNRGQNQEFSAVSANQQLKDRFYPLFTFLIRKTYGIGLGKALHAFFKKFNLLSRPMAQLQKEDISGLPNWYSFLIYKQFEYLKDDLNHRKKIASIYADLLDTSILSDILTRQIYRGANLRFPIFVKYREDLIGFLKKEGIFLSDIWYDGPIAPRKYLQLTDYDHECPNSEKTSSIIVNLPTHRNVSEKDARFIAKKVNEWTESK